MKITMISHSCLLIELGGKRILTDPWMTEPLYPRGGGDLSGRRRGAPGCRRYLDELHRHARCRLSRVLRAGM